MLHYGKNQLHEYTDSAVLSVYTYLSYVMICDVVM